MYTFIKKGRAKCKKSLYRSTYKGNAFTKNMRYEIVSIDKDFIFIKDNKNHIFDLKKIGDNNIFYTFGDYFEPIEYYNSIQSNRVPRKFLWPFLWSWFICDQ